MLYLLPPGQVQNFLLFLDINAARPLLAICLLLASAHLLGYLFKKMTLPKVIGEIAGGLILGPTALGHFFPGAYDWLFHGPAIGGKVMSLLYWTGLILLMLISGFETQTSFNRNDRKTILILLLGATVPFLIGWIVPSLFNFSPYLGTENNLLALKPVVAIAFAVTSIPVISRIFIDLGLINSHFAKIIIATATIQDMFLWVVLSASVGLVSSKATSITEVLTILVLTLALFIATLYMLPRMVRSVHQSGGRLFSRSSVPVFDLGIVFILIAVAYFFSINIVFAAFLSGIVLKLVFREKVEQNKHTVSKISLMFFIPFYFAIVGWKLDLINHFNFFFFLSFLLLSSAVKMLSIFFASRLQGWSWLTSLNFSFAMNTRGGPGIVLATIAFEAGIINRSFFSTLVITSIVTSLIAGCWFRLVTIKGWKLMSSAGKELASS